jgi:hypothetical protein
MTAGRSESTSEARGWGKGAGGTRVRDEGDMTETLFVAISIESEEGGGSTYTFDTRIRATICVVREIIGICQTTIWRKRNHCEKFMRSFICPKNQSKPTGHTAGISRM